MLGIIGDQQGTGPMALVIDDVQWADRRSVEAPSFTFRRLSVDAVAVILVVRGDHDQLDAPARRMILSVAQRRRVFLSGLSVDDVAPLPGRRAGRGPQHAAGKPHVIRAGGPAPRLRSGLPCGHCRRAAGSGGSGATGLAE